MTYTVSSGTLNPTQLNLSILSDVVCLFVRPLNHTLVDFDLISCEMRTVAILHFSVAVWDATTYNTVALLLIINWTVD